MQATLNPKVYRLFKKIQKNKDKKVIKIGSDTELEVGKVVSNFNISVDERINSIGIYGIRYWTLCTTEKVTKSRYLGPGRRSIYDTYRTKKIDKTDKIYLLSSELKGKKMKGEETITSPMLVTKYFPKSAYGTGDNTYALYSIADYMKYYKLVNRIRRIKGELAKQKEN